MTLIPQTREQRKRREYIMALVRTVASFISGVAGIAVFCKLFFGV